MKVQINKACRFVGQEAVQLHGGIGMTLEYIGAHHFKRLAMIEYQLGDTAHHLRRITQGRERAAGGVRGAEARSARTLPSFRERE